MQKMEYTAMTLDKKIHQYAQKLPLSFQEGLFDFVQYLLMKAEQQKKTGVGIPVTIFCHA